MDGRDWDKFLIPYTQTVEELKVKFKSMRAELKQREQYAPIEFVTGRVKKISSILEKAKKLSVPLDRLEEGIEDIAGIRMMCQFQEDINYMADLIRKRKDMTVVYEKDYITNKKDSGYRSYHIIINYPIQTAIGYKEVLAEIQLRTLAMNFWATIEHSLNYKYKENIPEDVRDRLKNAAEAAYQLDREMSAIRSQIVESQKLFEEKTNLVTRVLNDIQQLYFHGYAKKAFEFQKKFSDYWENEGSWKLHELSAEIKKELLKAEQSNLNNGK